MSAVPPARPAHLRAGARVGVIAPASPVADRDRVDRGVAALEQLGYAVELRVDPVRHHGYLAGNDGTRAAALVAALTDDDLDAVLCLRGGVGSMRTLLALPDGAAARVRAARPKALIGYSDVTVLHAWLQAEIGWVGFSGPVLTSFADATPYTVAAFQQALAEPAPFAVAVPDDHPAPRTVASGRAAGPLTGGCLSLVQSLIATPWQPAFDGALLCLEEIGEPPRRIDQMLTQLRAAGLLQRVAGVLVGELVGCHPGVRGDAYPHSLTLDDVLDELLAPLGVPVLYGLPIGHGRHLATLPLGVHAELDADAGTLRVDAAVR